MLSLAPEEGDTEFLAYVIGKWPEPLYRHASSLKWLEAAYRRYPEAVRSMVDGFLVDGVPAEIQARAVEACQVMRTIDQAQALS